MIPSVSSTPALPRARFCGTLFVVVSAACLVTLCACSFQIGVPPGGVDAVASRTHGVAPLAVHFYAEMSGDADVERSFRENEYAWDFSDPGSGQWGSNGKDKNSAKGAVAAHVFESPGVFRVQVSAYTKYGLAGTDSVTVVVDDPDIYYAGTKTICVSDTSDFSGAPAGALTLPNTVDLSVVVPYATAGKRILFRRGGAWSTGGLSWPGNSGSVTIGAFGAGTPDAYGIYANAPSITVTSGSFLQMDGKQDWRVMDLHLIDPTRSYGCFGGSSEMQRLLFLHLTVEGFANTLGWSHWNTSKLMTLDQMAIVSCNLSEGSGNVVYAGGERFALLGNNIYNARTSHVVRIWQAYKSVISDNLISGASLDETDGRHSFKLHGPGYSTLNGTNEYGTPVPNTGLLKNPTEFVVVSGNVFGSSGPWPVAIGPQDGLTDCALSNIIFERNRIITEFGIQSPGSLKVDIALHLWGRYFVIRNNVFDGTGSGSDYTGIVIEKRGVEPSPVGVEVYNNTFFRADNNFGNQRIGVSVGSSAKGTLVKNNLISFPGATIPTKALLDLGVNSTTGSNLITGAPSFIDAYNGSPLLRKFRQTQGSPGYNLGTFVPLYEDFEEQSRPKGPYDIGAFEN